MHKTFNNSQIVAIIILHEKFQKNAEFGTDCLNIMNPKCLKLLSIIFYTNS